MRRVYLPRWQRWVLPPLMLLIWGLITYAEFWSAQRGELGTVGYALLTLIFLGLTIVLWLMASGRLPAYLIEDDPRR